MADRYWVGGSGTWNTTNTANWSTGSGGGSGASVPTAADSVFFDQASTYTVTMTGALACLDITVSAGTVTFATGTGPTLAISGSMSLVAGTVWSSTAGLTFNSTTTGKTITTNGVTMSGAITLNGVGGGWTLGSALTMNTNSYANGIFTLTNGTFDTGNYNMTLSIFSSSNSNTRSITLGTSTLTVGRWTLTTTTNLTFSGASSTINFNAINACDDAFDGGGLTYGTVSVNGRNSACILNINGANTFSTFSVVARTSTGTSPIAFSANQTITTLTLNAPTLANRRTFIISNTYGTQRTVTVTNITATVTDYDFRDIVISGTTLTGTRIGNGDNCSGITFSAAKTVYWNKAAGGNWTDTDAWAASSGAGTASTNYPLMQDTAVIENTGLNASATVTLDSNPNIGSIDASARTTAMTLAQPGGYAVYGNFVMGSGVTLSGAANGVSFLGRANQTVTMNTATFTRPMTVEKFAGAVELGDAFSSSNSLTLTRGTFDAKTHNVTIASFVSGISNTRTLNMGSGTWTLSGTGTVWNISALTGLTLNAGTANIVLSDTSSTARTFAGAGLTYNDLTIGGASGTSTLTISGSNTFKTLASTKTVAHTISFTGGTTQRLTTGFTVSGTLGNVVTVGSTTTTAVTLIKPTAWYVGANSTDGGNNTGLSFISGGGIDYLSISRINGRATYAGNNNLLFGSNF